MKKANDTERGWDRAQVRSFVRDAIKMNQAAWDLVPTMRTAIIAQKYAFIVSGQVVDTIATAKLTTLWTDMLKCAGLTDAP